MKHTLDVTHVVLICFFSNWISIIFFNPVCQDLMQCVKFGLNQVCCEGDQEGSFNVKFIFAF